MSANQRGSRSPLLIGILVLVVALAATVLSACGGGDSTTGGSSTSEPTATEGSEPTATEGSGGGSGLAGAEKDLQTAYSGYFTHPPTEPNPAVPGKRILIISAGQSAEVDSALATKIQQAASMIGWTSSICDGKLEPGNFVKCMGQANAEGVDGVVNIGVDCQYVKPQMEQAVKSGIKIVGTFAWDCSETEPGGPKLMTKISYGNRFKSEPEAFEALGRGAGAWAVVKTKGQGKILYLVNHEYNTLKLLQTGFKDAVEELCEECELDEEEWLGKELGPPLQSKTLAALTSNPEINAMYANTNPELGPSAALVQSGRQTEVASVGGLGVAPNFEAIREEQGLGATLASPGGWYAFAAVDTLNSLFRGQKPRDEGWGGILVDAEHNLPPKGSEGYYEPPNVDYEADYAKSWGVKGN
jgi:ribose transport system substrate-binding protein